MSVPVETGPAGLTNPSCTLTPPPLVFPWWEQWQRLVETSIHWKQLSRQDFPNILQQEVALFVSSMCSCFRSILPCCCPHIQSLSPFTLCFDSFNVAQMIQWYVELCVFVHTADRRQCGWGQSSSPLILWRWYHHQQSEQLSSAVMTKDNNGELSCAVLSLITDHTLRHQTLLVQDVPACFNGLLDIDLATQKEELSFYPI